MQPDCRPKIARSFRMLVVVKPCTSSSIVLTCILGHNGPLQQQRLHGPRELRFVQLSRMPFTMRGSGEERPAHTRGAVLSRSPRLCVHLLLVRDTP